MYWEPPPRIRGKVLAPISCTMTSRVTPAYTGKRLIEPLYTGISDLRSALIQSLWIHLNSFYFSSFWIILSSVLIRHFRPSAYICCLLTAGRLSAFSQTRLVIRNGTKMRRTGPAGRRERGIKRMDKWTDGRTDEKSDGDARQTFMQASVAAPCGWAEDSLKSGSSVSRLADVCINIFIMASWPAI